MLVDFACHRYCCIVKVGFELYCLSELVDVVLVGSRQLAEMFYLFICTVCLVVCKQHFEDSGSD